MLSPFSSVSLPSSRLVNRFSFGILCLSIAILAMASPPPLIAQEYPLGRDSLKQEGVPTGKVTKHAWNESKIFPGTERDYWIYVPAQYTPQQPACVMIFQDGQGYVTDNGHSRVPTVFDNLIHQQAMPVMIGIFINPGQYPSTQGNKPRSNRSFEYDSLGDLYARFLLEEILPEVRKQYNLTNDREGYALAGISSEESVPSPRPGSVLNHLAKSSVMSVASRTFAEAISIQP